MRGEASRRRRSRVCRSNPAVAGIPTSIPYFNFMAARRKDPSPAGDRIGDGRLEAEHECPAGLNVARGGCLRAAAQAGPHRL